MAGGTWTTQNKVRPGAYINVASKGTVSTSETTTGVVTLPLPLKFGPEKEVVRIVAASDLTTFGYDLGSADMLLLREALKQASEVLLYRIGSGEKAAATGEGEGLTVTALYAGSRGNDINVTAQANVNVEGAFDVKTFLASSLIDTQTVKKIEDLVDNRLVTFSGTGEIKEFSEKLAGGKDTEGTAQDYADYFSAVQVYDFNTMALPVNDEAVKVAGAAFIKRMREEEGKKCQLVVAGYKADNEAIINVKNGVVLADGTRIDAAQATAWVAAAEASAGVATSLTYKSYDGAVDVTQRYLNTDIIAALQAGEFVFTEKRGEAVIEQDINSLTNFTSDKGKVFSKNRLLRVLDDIANNSKKTFEDNYIGKVNNDIDGREMFKADRIAYFNSLQAAGAITNFDAEDIEVLPGIDQDAVVLNAAVQPVDAMEKLYMSVEVLGNDSQTGGSATGGNTDGTTTP